MSTKHVQLMFYIAAKPGEGGLQKKEPSFGKRFNAAVVIPMNEQFSSDAAQPVIERQSTGGSSDLAGIRAITTMPHETVWRIKHAFPGRTITAQIYNGQQEEWADYNIA